MRKQVAWMHLPKEPYPTTLYAQINLDNEPAQLPHNPGFYLMDPLLLLSVVLHSGDPQFQTYSL